MDTFSVSYVILSHLNDQRCDIFFAEDSKATGARLNKIDRTFPLLPQHSAQNEMKLYLIEKVPDQLVVNMGVLVIITEKITNIMAYDAQVFRKICRRRTLGNQLIGLLQNKEKIIIYDMRILNTA